MAKRLYVEGNYIKVDGDNGLISEYPLSSLYDTRDGHLKLTHPDGFKASFIDPTEWLDSEVGGVFYTYDTMEAFFEQNSAATAFSSASGGGALELTVDMTSPNILGANPVGAGMFELIPAPAAGEYIDVQEAILEYTNNSIVYAMAAVGWKVQYSGGSVIYLINKSVCTTASDQIRIATRSFSTTTSIDVPIPTNESVGIISSDLFGFTLGDGTMKIKLTYFIRTLG